MHICIHIYEYTYMYECAYTCMHVFVYGHVRTHECTSCCLISCAQHEPDCLHAYVYIFVYVYVHECTRTCTGYASSFFDLTASPGVNTYLKRHVHLYVHARTGLDLYAPNAIQECIHVCVEIVVCICVYSSSTIFVVLVHSRRAKPRACIYTHAYKYVDVYVYENI